MKTLLLYELWTEDVGCQPGAMLTRHVVGERGLELLFHDSLQLDRVGDACIACSRWSFFTVYDSPFPIRLFVGGRAVERSSCAGFLFASRTGPVCLVACLMFGDGAAWFRRPDRALVASVGACASLL